MARTRIIKPAFFKNEVLADLKPHIRLLFIGLWVLADREGRLEERPARIRAEIFPYESVDVKQGIEALSQAGFITRYTLSGQNYIQINNFDKHQRPHPKEQPSAIPESGEGVPNSGKDAPKSDEPQLSGPLIFQSSNPLILQSSNPSIPKPEQNPAPTHPKEQVEAIVKEWNALAKRTGIPPVRALNEKRRRAVRTRLRDPSFDYSAVLAAIERSPFLRGENDRGWKVGFDFVFESAGNFLKILEGKYDGKANGGQDSGSGRGGGRQRRDVSNYELGQSFVPPGSTHH